MTLVSTAERVFLVIVQFCFQGLPVLAPSNWAPRWAFYPLTSLAHRCNLVIRLAQAMSCPSATPARNLPAGSKPAAAIETGNSKLETRDSEINPRRSDPAGTLRTGVRTNPTVANLRFESHDMYEKTGTYAKNTRWVEKRMLLITSRLAYRFSVNVGNEGKLKSRAKATML